jgi:hypothetical protein
VSDRVDRRGDDAARERRTSSRVDFFVERAIDEAQRGIAPDWGPITLEESWIMRLRLRSPAPAGATSESPDRDPDEIELCAGGWEIPDRLRPFRSRGR